MALAPVVIEEPTVIVAFGLGLTVTVVTADAALLHPLVVTMTL
jgi:hypothetical protein